MDAAELTRPLADRMRPQSLEEFVGQVQVVMDGWPPATEVERVARELMQLVPVDCVKALKGAVADDVAAGPSRAQASDGVRARSVRMYGMPRLTVWDRGQGEEP